MFVERTTGSPRSVAAKADGHEIGETLAGSRARLDDHLAGLVDRVGHRLRHLLLLFAPLEARDDFSEAPLWTNDLHDRAAFNCLQGPGRLQGFLTRAFPRKRDLWRQMAP